MVGIAVVNSCAVVNSPKDRRISWLFKLENGACLVREICPQSDLSSKTLYLRPDEYWSHLMHIIKNLRISINACTECPMLYNKTLSIKLVNHPGPSSKNGPDFSHHFLSNF
jgi:hypothetical protein